MVKRSYNVMVLLRKKEIIWWENYIARRLYGEKTT